MTDVALRFGAKDVGLAAQFRKVNQDLETFKTKAAGVGSAIGTTFRGLAGVVAAVGVAKLASEALEFADAQRKMSDQTGLTVEQTQRLTFFAAQTSVEVGNLTSGVVRLQRVLGGLEEGSEASAQALERLGLAHTNFQALDPEQQFTAVAQAVSGLATQNEKVLAVTELFGKAGAELLPVLTAIGRESETLEEKFAAIGGPVGRDTIEVVDQLGDEFATTGLAVKSMATELLGVVSPAIIAGLEKVQQIIGGIRIIAGGGDNEQVNIDSRIRGLQHELDLQQSLAYPDQRRVKTLQEEIAALTAKLNLIQGIGAEGRRQALALQSPFGSDFGVKAPGQLSFEESDQERKEREELEANAPMQRMRALANAQLFERQLEMNHNKEMLKINEERLAEELNQQSMHEMRSLQIMSGTEEWMRQIREFYALEEIELREFTARNAILTSLGLVNALAGHSSTVAKLQKGLAKAQAIRNTVAAVTRAFRDYPWPYSAGVAALVAVQGYAQVRQIDSTNYSPSGGSSGGSAPTIAGGGASIGGRGLDSESRGEPNVQQPQGATQVYISGMITRDIVDYMVEGLRDGFNRDVIVIPTNSLQAQMIRG